LLDLSAKPLPLDESENVTSFSRLSLELI